MLKADAQYRHAMRRAKERLGFELTHDEYNDLIKQIQNGRVVKIWSQTRKIGHFLMTVRGKKTRVVYDSSTQAVVTFLNWSTETQHAIRIGQSKEI